MLVIRRKATDVITIEPLAGADTSMSIGELFTNGGIEITLLEINQKVVKVAIDAPAELKIWRGHGPKTKQPPKTLAVATPQQASRIVSKR